MLEQIEGSQAVAKAVAACRPEVVAAYPISPQTHIVETLSRLVKSGELTGCEYVNVESEYSAMSACIGASAAGARSYTATASQGLLYMVEPVYNASGLGLPIVMTVANRAIGSPITPSPMNPTFIPPSFIRPRRRSCARAASASQSNRPRPGRSPPWH